MSTVTIVAIRKSDGKEFRTEWNPKTETIRDALEREGFSKMAQVEDVHVDPCASCGSRRVFDDGTCADCSGVWPQKI